MAGVIYNAIAGEFCISALCANFMADLGHGAAIEMLGDFEKTGNWYGDIIPYSITRHDPLLVLAWKTLGPIKVSGKYCELSLYEIAGNRYFIKEYDGMEMVIETNDLDWTYIDV